MRQLTNEELGSEWLYELKESLGDNNESLVDVVHLSGSLDETGVATWRAWTERFVYLPEDCEGQLRVVCADRNPPVFRESGEKSSPTSSGIAALLTRWSKVIVRQKQWGVLVDPATGEVQQTAIEQHAFQLHEASRHDGAWLLDQAWMFRLNPQVCRVYCEVYARLMGSDDEGEGLFRKLRGSDVIDT